VAPTAPTQEGPLTDDENVRIATLDTGCSSTRATPAALMSVGNRLLAHLRRRYGIDAVAATKINQHYDVFRIDRRDGASAVQRRRGDPVRHG